MSLLQKKYLRVNPLSDRTGNNFNSSVDFQFVNSGLDYVNFQETTLVVRLGVAGANISGLARTLLAQYNNTSGLAPTGTLAWNPIGCAFKSATQMINSQVISRLDNCQQSDTFVKRITYSQSYRNSGVGAAQALQTNPIDRDEQIKDFGEIELEWRPNFGLFNQQELLPPTCLNQFSFEVYSQYQKAMLLSLSNYSLTTTQGGSLPAASIDISVKDIYLRVCLHTLSDAMTDGVMDFQFVETQSSSQTITSTNQNLQFNVPPSTFRLGIFHQDAAAGTDFRVPPSQFKTLTPSGLSYEQQVQNLQITYGSQVFPNPQYNLDNVSGVTGSNKWNTPYWDSMLASGRAFNETGLETFDTWYNVLGPIFLAQFLKPAEDRNTNVNVSVVYKVQPVNTLMWLMSSFTRNCRIAYTAGQASSVIVEDI